MPLSFPQSDSFKCWSEAYQAFEKPDNFTLELSDLGIQPAKSA